MIFFFILISINLCFNSTIYSAKLTFCQFIYLTAKLKTPSLKEKFTADVKRAQAKTSRLKEKLTTDVTRAQPKNRVVADCKKKRSLAFATAADDTKEDSRKGPGSHKHFLSDDLCFKKRKHEVNISGPSQFHTESVLPSGAECSGNQAGHVDMTGLVAKQMSSKKRPLDLIMSKQNCFVVDKIDQFVAKRENGSDRMCGAKIDVTECPISVDNDGGGSDVLMQETEYDSVQHISTAADFSHSHKSNEIVCERNINGCKTTAQNTHHEQVLGFSGNMDPKNYVNQKSDQDYGHPGFHTESVLPSRAECSGNQAGHVDITCLVAKQMSSEKEPLNLTMSKQNCSVVDKIDQFVAKRENGSDRMCGAKIDVTECPISVDNDGGGSDVLMQETEYDSVQHISTAADFSHSHKSNEIVCERNINGCKTTAQNTHHEQVLGFAGNIDPKNYVNQNSDQDCGHPGFHTESVLPSGAECSGNQAGHVDITCLVAKQMSSEKGPLNLTMTKQNCSVVDKIDQFVAKRENGSDRMCGAKIDVTECPISVDNDGGGSDVLMLETEYDSVQHISTAADFSHSHKSNEIVCERNINGCKTTAQNTHHEQVLGFSGNIEPENYVNQKSDQDNGHPGRIDTHTPLLGLQGCPVDFIMSKQNCSYQIQSSDNQALGPGCVKIGANAALARIPEFPLDLTISKKTCSNQMQGKSMSVMGKCNNQAGGDTLDEDENGSEKKRYRGEIIVGTTFQRNSISVDNDGSGGILMATETESDKVQYLNTDVDQYVHKTDAMMCEKNAKDCKRNETKHHKWAHEISGSSEPDINQNHDVDKDWATRKAICQPDETSIDENEQDCLSLSAVDGTDGEEYVGTDYGEEEASGSVLVQETKSETVQYPCTAVDDINVHKTSGTVCEKNTENCMRTEKTKHHEWVHNFSQSGEPEINQSDDMNKELVTSKVMCQPDETSTDGNEHLSLSSVDVDIAECMGTDDEEEASGGILMREMKTENDQYSCTAVDDVYVHKPGEIMFEKNTKDCMRSEKTKHNKWAQEFSGICEPEINRSHDVDEEFVTDKVVCQPYETSTDGNDCLSLTSMDVEDPEEYMGTDCGEEEGSGGVLMQGTETENVQNSSTVVNDLYMHETSGKLCEKNMKDRMKTKKTKHQEWANEFSGSGELEHNQSQDVHEEWVTDKVILQQDGISTDEDEQDSLSLSSVDDGDAEEYSGINDGEEGQCTTKPEKVKPKETGENESPEKTTDKRTTDNKGKNDTDIPKARRDPSMIDQTDPFLKRMKRQMKNGKNLFVTRTATFTHEGWVSSGWSNIWYSSHIATPVQQNEWTPISFF